MLDTNITNFKNVLNSTLNFPDEGYYSSKEYENGPTPKADALTKNPFYTAAYYAFYEVSKPKDLETPKDDEGEPDEETAADFKAQSESTKKESEISARKCAHEFGKAFCQILQDSSFMNTIADAVNNHIKSLEINIDKTIQTSVIYNAYGADYIKTNLSLNSNNGGITIK